MKSNLSEMRNISTYNSPGIWFDTAAGGVRVLDRFVDHFVATFWRERSASGIVFVKIGRFHEFEFGRRKFDIEKGLNIEKVGFFRRTGFG